MDKKKNRIAQHIISLSTSIVKGSVGKSTVIIIHEVPIPKLVKDFCNNKTNFKTTV